MARATLGVIVGNRDFFPDALVTEAREDVLALFEEMDIEPVILDAEATKLGGVETWREAQVCAELFDSRRKSIEGVPAAAYDSGIEFQGGLYVVEESVVVAAGKSHGVNFSVPHMAKKAKPKSPAAPAKSSKPSFLKGPLTTALVVVGAAFAVGLIVDNVSDDSNDDSDDASPFNN